MRANDKSNKIAIRSDSIIEARYSLTARQNNIIDMLLSDLNNDDKTTYEIRVDSYKNLYHMDTSNIYRDLRNAVDSFKGKGFKTIDDNTGNEVYYVWFSKIEYVPKEGKIKVNIDKDLKKLLYEVKKKIYYNIEYTLNFSSAYSQRVYFYLKSFEDTKWRKDKVEDLILKLECPNSYKNFANFKKYVLEVAKSEINGNSDILFDYTAEKTGKKVTHVFFTIKKKIEINNPVINELAVGAESVSIPTLTYDYVNGLSSYTFDLKETTDLITAANKYFNPDLGYQDINVFYKTNFELAYQYYEQKDGEIPLIKLVISSLKGDWASKQKQPNYKKKSVGNQRVGKKLKFTDYEQREYDYDKLEDKLTSWYTKDIDSE